MFSISRSRLFPSTIFDDWVNRLNNFWTFYVFLLLSGITGWQKYQSDRIGCWFPKHFTSAMIDYGYKECGNAKTFYIPQDSNSLSSNHVRQEMSFSVYQWIPLLLALQALLFKLPHVIWVLYHGYSGVNTSKIQRLTQDAPATTWADRRTTAAMAARYLDSWLQLNILGCLPWRVLALLAGFVKFLYLINAVTQLAVVDSLLLPENKSNFGYHYLNALMGDESLALPLPRFPHKIACDFKIRELNNIQSWTVQCVLPINESYEHIYCFVWVWLLFVAIVTTFNFLVWFVKTTLPFFRTR